MFYKQSADDCCQSNKRGNLHRQLVIFHGSAGCVMLRTAALDGYDPEAPLVLIYLAGVRLPTTIRYFHPSAPCS